MRYRKQTLTIAVRTDQESLTYGHFAIRTAKIQP